MKARAAGTDSDTVFKPAQCPRGCGAVVLAGRCDAMPWRMDVGEVLTMHAAVLVHYGVCVIALEATLAGLRPRLWRTGDRRPGFLVAPHQCGSAHSQPRKTT